MSIIMNGTSSHVTTPLMAVITAFTDNGSGAVRVTTAAPHLFGPNDLVLIQTPVLTGAFVITVIDSTDFDLIASSYTSTSTGFAVDTSLTPQVLVPTDGDTFSMQLSGMLSAIQACLDRDQYLNTQVVESVTTSGNVADKLAAQNWSQSFIATSGPGGADFGAAKWDGVGNWLLLTLHQGTTSWDAFIGKGLDAGAAAAWTGLGSATTESYPVLAQDICVDPTTTTDYWASVIVNSGTTYRIHIYQYVSGTWTNKLNFGSTVSTGAFYGTSLLSFNGYIINATSANDATSAIHFSNNGGSSWGSFFAGTPNMPSGSEWLLKSNLPASLSGHVLAIPANAGLGAATGVWKSTDGATWAQSATLSMLSGTESVVGLAWTNDGIADCWVAMVQTGSGTTETLRSIDGVTWTVQDPTGPANNVADMASFVSTQNARHTLVCSLEDEATPYPSGSIYSVDGGLTWQANQARLFANDVGSDGYTRARVTASPGGFLLYNSLWARFSALSGPTT